MTYSIERDGPLLRRVKAIEDMPIDIQCEWMDELLADIAVALREDWQEIRSMQLDVQNALEFLKRHKDHYPYVARKAVIGQLETLWWAGQDDPFARADEWHDDRADREIGPPF